MSRSPVSLHVVTTTHRIVKDVLAGRNDDLDDVTVFTAHESVGSDDVAIKGPGALDGPAVAFPAEGMPGIG